jgi:hypothetical protein
MSSKEYKCLKTSENEIAALISWNIQDYNFAYGSVEM